jgi:hypothetical protein
MNKIILDTFYQFTVDGEEIPVDWLKYKGKKTKYVVFSDLGETPASHGDDECEYSIKQFDFDIYANGNYLNILKAVKQRLKDNGWTWVEDSPTSYEEDTGLYHITTTFEKENYIE